jgi:hypothetical protein
MPGSVPAMLDSPISTPACCGAMSRWLTLKALIRVVINSAACYAVLLLSVVLVAVFVSTSSCLIDTSVKPINVQKASQGEAAETHCGWEAGYRAGGS